VTFAKYIMTMPSRHSSIIAPLVLATLLTLGCATNAATRETGDQTVNSVNTPHSSAAILLDPTNPEWRRPAPAISHLRFETTRGMFVLELVRAWGPIGADRFYNLARLGYYNDARFHRVDAGYIAQWGINGDPAVNAAWKNQQIADDPPRSHNVRGTFAFAQFGPGHTNTRNTEVYVNLKNNPRSDTEPFTMLGTVVDGMNVLDSLYSGYGEKSGGGLRQGKQGLLEEGGNAYMDREFPLLDRILKVTVTTVQR
jgi:cyclophilin family peptidyl-prolyl cis-trans isomerase